VDRRQDPHASPAGGAFQDIYLEHAPHQLGPGVVPGARAAVPRIAGPIAGARLGTGQSFRLAPLRRKILNQMSPVEAMELLIDKMSKSAANEQFLMMMQGG
jgi:hypothetical protein